MQEIGKIEMRVPETVIDGNGHVNNVHYIQWMQDTALAHSAALGWSRERYTALGRTWVVRSHNIEYLHPAYAGDSITIFTWVAAMHKIRCLRKFKFFRPGDQTTLAMASTLFILCDLHSGRPIPIPEEMLQAYPVIGPEGEP